MNRTLAALALLAMALLPSQLVRAGPSLQADGFDAMVVGDQDLNVRAGPGLDQPILGSLPLGTRVTVVGGPVPGDGWTWCQHASAMGRGWSVCVALATPDGLVSGVVPPADAEAPAPGPPAAAAPPPPPSGVVTSSAP